MGLETPPADEMQTPVPEETTADVQTAEAPKDVLMIDATHAHVHNIPTGTPKVAGYDTGTPDIDWNSSDWADFPNSGHVIIDQSYKENPGFKNYAEGKANVADVEAGTATIAEFVDASRQRFKDGRDAWIYGGRDVIKEAAGELTGKEQARTGAWLADWSLSESEAQALIGTSISGIRVVAVQWASPSSNPTMIVPGSSLTLKDAQVDLSVTEAGWFAKTSDVSMGQVRTALVKIVDALESVAPEMELLASIAGK